MFPMCKVFFSPQFEALMERPQGVGR